MNCECLVSECNCHVLSVDAHNVNAFEASSPQVKETNEELRQLTLIWLTMSSTWSVTHFLLINAMHERWCLGVNNMR